MKLVLCSVITRSSGFLPVCVTYAYILIYFHGVKMALNNISFLLFLFGISLFCVATIGEMDTTFQNEEFRLSKSVWPENYRMEFLVILDPLPEFERFTAPAKTWITVNCSEPTSTITMHAINLTINESTIKVKNLASGQELLVLGISYRTEFDFIDIQLGTSTQAFELYEIFIEFITPISGDRLNGMYQDFYVDSVTNETRYIATTLFAPFHARRAFPCFDEPFFRATYDITLGHHTKYHAMSNTEIISSRPIDNMTAEWQWDTFETTPSISSYIIAMIVSDLEYEEGPVGGFRNVSVRIYAKPESIEMGAGSYSAKLVGDVMTFFESLFQVPYPISKLYSVALPQFFFNAMENWGLITYKEPILLYLPDETTEQERYKINYVLSHELGHQYFGNLVACDWWAYVWLKEGFATYYSHHGMQQTNPELAPWVNFISKVMYVAMNFDSTNATHPLENFPPTSPAVAQIYTRIPYEKGASILRMASSILTESVFLTGIKGYVNDFQYKTAVQDNVFEELQQAVNDSPLISSMLPTTVKVIMDSWTRQQGFPVLRVSAPSSNLLQITQEKYIDGDESNPDTTWWVPIYLSPRPNETLPQNFPDTWIAQGTTSISINADTERVNIVNPFALGYYRVLYDGRMLEGIVKQLTSNHELLSPTTRSKIIYDYAHFVLTGYADATTLITLTSYLDQELDFLVWDGLYQILETISKLLETTTVGKQFKTYFGQKAFNALELLEAKYCSNSQDLEVGENAMLRSLLMKLSCDFGEEACIQKSVKFFNNWRTTKAAKIPLSVQDAVFCTAINQDLDGSAWEHVYKIAMSSGSHKQFSPLTSRLLRSLGCSVDKQQLQIILNQIKTQNTSMNKEDKLDIIMEIAKTLVGSKMILEELELNKEIMSIFESKTDFGNFMHEISSHMLSDNDITSLKNIRDILPDTRKAAIDNAISRIYKNRKVGESISNAMILALQK